MAENIQIKIGENGEVVELPLKRYQELLLLEKLATENVCIPAKQFEDFVNMEEEFKKLLHYKDTSEGLWCTDRPDLVKCSKDIMFQLKY